MKFISRFVLSVLTICLCLSFAVMPVFAAEAAEQPIVTIETDKTAYTGRDTITQTVSVENVTGKKITNVAITGDIPEGYATKDGITYPEEWAAEIIEEIAAGDTETVQVKFYKESTEVRPTEGTEATEETKDTEDTDDDDKDDDDKDDKDRKKGFLGGIANTGDNSHIGFWTVTALVCGCLLFVLLRKGKGKKLLAFFLAASMAVSAFAAGPVKANAAGTKASVDAETTIKVNRKNVTLRVHVEYETEAEETPVTPETDLSYDGYTKVWADEFNGTALNRDDWNVELHDPGWVNAEWQEYVDSEENIYIEDGNLILKPVQKIDESGNASYTSGRVNTQGKHDFKYGIFEARVKVPKGMGYLPAFWLMATDENLYGQWPRCGEIDIMEVMGQSTNTSHGTVHYGNPHAQSQGTYVTEGDFSEEYHTFAVEWEPGRIRWYVDGDLFHEESDWYSATEGQGTISYPAPFDQPFYVILNLAIGGSWVGYPDETTTYEDQAYAIDYVRVWQKNSYDENVQKPEQEIVMREPDATGNYIINGDFAVEEALDDEADWIFLTALEGEGSAQIKDEQLDITTVNAGTVDYSIQLVQPNVPIAKGGVYKLTFDMSADEARTVIVDISAPERSWIRYLNDTKIDVGPETQSYEFEFTMTGEDDPYGRLEFNLGNQGSVAGVHLDNVRLEKTGQIEIEETKGVLADGNHVYNGSFQEGADRMEYWTVQAGEGAEVSVTNENNIRKLKIVAPEGTSAENPIVIYQEELPLASSSNYAISYSVEGPAGKTVQAEAAGESFDAVLDGSEQKITGVFTTPDGDFSKTIKFTVTEPGTYYLDDVRIEEDSMIKNGSFNAGLAGYEPYVDSSASATYTVDSLREDNAFDITINDTGDQDWKIQLKQNNVSLVQGQWYRLTLEAKSDLDRQFMVALQRDGSIHGDDWTPYCQETFDLTSEYQTYIIEFQMNPGTEPFSDPQTVLSISMGAVGGTRITQQHRICIDNISLEEIDEPESAVTPKPAGEELIVNGDFSDGANNWTTMAVTAPAAGSINVVDGKAVVDITNVGTADWNVQMIHYGIQLDQGSTYKLTFTGSSTVQREMAVNMMSSTYDWYAGTNPVLTPEEQTFTMEFTMDKATNEDAGLFISMGVMSSGETPASTITLDDFSLRKVGGDETDTDLIVNGDFADGADGWDSMAVQGDAAGTIEVVDGKVVANITNVGTEDWNVQMIQTGIQLEQGADYQLAFEGSSTVERDIKIAIMSTDGNYSWYGGSDEVLKGEVQTFTVNFTMSGETDTNAGLYVSMGKTANAAPSTITLDNFSLRKLPADSGKEPETPVITPKPVGEELIGNGNFASGLDGWVCNGGTLSIADGKASIDITNPGAAEWDIQMIYSGIQLEKGSTYELTFKGSSTVDRNIKIVFMSNDGTYDWYGGQDAVALTTAEQSISIRFAMQKATNTDAAMFISMGKMGDNTPASTITFSDFSLKKLPADSGDEPDTPEITPKDYGEELIVNGNFGSDDSGWDSFSVVSPAEGSINVVDGKVVAEVTNVGTADWNVQMIQSGIQLEQGCTYELNFKGSSTIEREIKVVLMSTDGNYKWYGIEDTIALTADEELYTVAFTMNEATDTNAGLFISMGEVADNTPASTITLDDFSLKKLDPAALADLEEEEDSDESTDIEDDVDSADITDDADTTDTTEDTDTTDDADSADTTDDTDSVDTTDDDDSTDTTDDAESTNTAENTGSTDTADGTDSTDTTEDTDSTDTTDHGDSTDTTGTEE